MKRRLIAGAAALVLLAGTAARLAVADAAADVTAATAATTATLPTAAMATATAAPPGDGAAALLGRAMFFDPSLSASGKMACASCHSPARAYGPPNGLAAQLGGPTLKRQGTRAVPSLRYVLNRTPRWTHVVAASFGERIEDTDAAPFGGFGWDGRFNFLRDQATFPLFNPDEMANRNPADVVRKLQAAPYAGRFRDVFGMHVFDDPKRALNAAMSAIERFELDDPSFHPYTSKFDAYLDGQAKLTARELRGKQLFDDSDGGNCASCHIDQPGADGSHPLFTDFSFEAVGVPRNRELRVNADPRYYDMGLCGPLRSDQAEDKSNCGLFKTPSLRNVATRQVFFHNGRFHDLKAALRFYVERDTDPQKWYPTDRHGRVNKFDDLPVALRDNVDTTDNPFTRQRGEKPVWSERDIDDVAAFLVTLDDGYSSPAGTAPAK
jgi:cytochrome c peroxidase